jgi:hypothetical protein
VGAGSEIFDYWQDSNVKTSNTFGFFTDEDRLDASAKIGHWQGGINRAAAGEVGQQGDALQWVQWGPAPPPALVGLVSRTAAKGALKLAIDNKLEQRNSGADLTPERLGLLALAQRGK